MSREEAINVLNTLASFQGVMEYFEQHSVSVQDACNMAIQALSQEPCDDAISRKDVINAIDKWISEYKPQHYLIQSIRELPPVTQKSGKWIWSDEIDRYVCDKCGQSDGKDKEMVESGEYPLSNYCPNCGCRMVEPQESEDKE